MAKVYPQVAPGYAVAFVSADQPPRASSRQQIVAVAAGGVVGTAARYAVAAVFTVGVHGFPWPTLLVNLAGSLALGIVVGVAGRDEHRPLLRPFLATGVLGAFTTYSTFAVETNDLLVTRPLLAIAYVLLSVTGGLAAASAGLRMAER